MTAVKIKIMAIAVALGLALGQVAGFKDAVAADVRALRDSPVSAPDKAPDVYKVQDGVKHERAYRQQPPLVPHATEKYEIDLKVNQCLRCHEWPYSDQEKAPKISDLHYIDRNGVRQDTVNGNRYFCTQCHVSQVDAKPLVENKFQPAVTGR
ncbi:nitrate reductase cytochrome c-type subunit [Magnetospirillum moscoviense]|uniref:nitrate reductase cytochrome c-type subunit n=1 Tax=Magnetospirillum moscoviense TaxID=1437059 RepID=UPI001FE22FAD|nr:nitrate reductase cytochrome c-type subunit [Magnetospirillum moscoviense]